MKVHTPILFGSYAMLQKRKSTKKSLVSSWLTGYFVKLSASRGQITPTSPINCRNWSSWKGFSKKKIKSWRKNGNHGISASNLLKFGKALWKFKQQSVSFSLLRSPFHPSGHLVNRTSKGEFIPCKVPTPFIPPRFIPCRCMSAAEMLSLDKSLSQRPGVVSFSASCWTRTTSCVLWNPGWSKKGSWNPGWLKSWNRILRVVVICEWSVGGCFCPEPRNFPMKINDFGNVPSANLNHQPITVCPTAPNCFGRKFGTSVSLWNWKSIQDHLTECLPSSTADMNQVVHSFSYPRIW